ncbi:response regulator [Aliirhizobium smilacinae]|uniref:Response regulator n=1 Tax=Aliirhizobium smilacinae TaxID=1395944 RepID=A0A5C4XHL4_9HYPH|nr:response regulator [Rhizobium smilacinae]TNM62064.1 response regulator [Rhizobium smilacinae]
MDQHPILLVEDDGLIRMDLADVLSDCGFDVLEAANADQALALLESETTVRALLTDIDMPGSMNGIKLANLTASRWPECRIIVISGRYSPEQGKLPDGARFLSKPISEHQLSCMLAELGVIASE